MSRCVVGTHGPQPEDVAHDIALPPLEKHCVFYEGRFVGSDNVGYYTMKITKKAIHSEEHASNLLVAVGLPTQYW